MMPGWPFPYVMVYATACLDWLLTVLLILPNVRIAAANPLLSILYSFSLQTYLLLVREYQENTEHALLWIRLIGQPIFIVWAMSIAKWEKS